jgi:hypothetical protein
VVGGGKVTFHHFKSLSAEQSSVSRQIGERAHRE